MSTDKGNFGLFSNSLLSLLGSASPQMRLELDIVLEKFKALKTNIERIDFVENIGTLHKFRIYPLSIVQKKDNQKSFELREAGNTMFRDKRSMDALLLYTRSVAYAEMGSSHLGLAFANRSAVLFEKGYYKACLEDIDRALQNHYPSHLEGKLFNRQQRAKDLQGKNAKSLCYYDPLPNITNKHPRISAAADCIELQRNDTFGTHVVTTRNVKAGEIISVEKPFVFDVSPESTFLHCHQCLELSFNMIPCENCVAVLYCSTACRAAALMSYHKYECDLRINKEFKTLSVKTVVLSAMEYKELKENTRNISDDMYRSDRYKDIHYLETNEHAKDIFQLFIYASMASQIFLSIKNDSNFLQETDLDENLIKEMLLHNLLIETSNSIGILKQNFLLGPNCGTSVPIAKGIYAFTSRYNHSCAPNCVYSHHGCGLVVRADMDIPKGEQCTISYGWGYGRKSREERQAMLKANYHFTCKCIACENFWPTYPGLDSEQGILEVLMEFVTHQTNVKYIEAVSQLNEILIAFRRDPVNIDKNQMLSRCFYLKSVLPKPSKYLACIQCFILYIYALSSNKVISF